MSNWVQNNHWRIKKENIISLNIPVKKSKMEFLWNNYKYFNCYLIIQFIINDLYKKLTNIYLKRGFELIILTPKGCLLIRSSFEIPSFLTLLSAFFLNLTTIKEWKRKQKEMKNEMILHSFENILKHWIEMFAKTLDFFCCILIKIAFDVQFLALDKDFN